MKKRLKSAGTEKKSLLSRWFAGSKYTIIAFSCTAMIMIFVYYCFSMYPFGEKVILRMDLYHQYGPLFAELYERVVGMRSFLYSWNTGLGSSFLGNFYNYLSSPLSLLIVFAGHKNIPETIAVLILMKAGLASAAFCHYLGRSQSKRDYSTAAFGVLYSVCGFFIAYYWNVMWLDAMVLFPLAMLGIEKIIKERKPGLYVFSLTMTILTNYYMAFMLCLFSVLFYLVSYFGSYAPGSFYGDEKTGPPEESHAKKTIFQKIRRSRLLGSGFAFAWSSVFSLCIAAFALLPVYYILQASSATDNPKPENMVSYYKIFDFLANHLANVEPTIRSSGTDVLPNVYCGIAAVLLLPLYLFTKTVKVREKAAYVLLLGLFYFSFNMNMPNFVWHGFHFPNDLPYRFSFMYSFVLLLLAYKTFTRLHELSGKQILGTGIALLCAVVIIQKIGSKNVSDITVVTSISFAVLYTLVFSMISSRKYSASAMTVLFLCSVVAEVCVANTDNYSINQTKSAYAGDLAEFQELKKKMDKLDGGFYRMELTNLRTRMDPAWYDYNGVSTFSSMAYEKTANLQSRLGLYSNYINSYTYNPQTPVYNMMSSLKYVVNNDSSIQLPDNFYSKLAENGKFTAYKNLRYLPIAYCVDSELLRWEHSTDNPFDVQTDYFLKAAGIGDVFERVEITDAYYYNIDEIYSGYDTGEFTYFKTEAGSDASVTFIVTPRETQNCYLYVRSDNVETVNISSYDFNLSKNDTSYIIDLGVRQAGEEISVELPISSGDSGSIDLFCYTLDNEKFDEGYRKLREGQMNIETFEETRIKGHVTAKEDCLLYSSIPFDKGWQVTVNGSPVDENDLVALGGGLLGFHLSKGNHTIELRYMPKGLWAGTFISLTAVALALLVLIIIKTIKRKRKRDDYFAGDFTTEPDFDSGSLSSIKPGSYSSGDFRLSIPEDSADNAAKENDVTDTQPAAEPASGDTQPISPDNLNDMEIIVENCEED